MAKSSKKVKYPLDKSNTDKVSEPIIDGLEVKEELVKDSEEDLLKTKSLNQFDIESNSIDKHFLRTKFLSNSFVLIYSLNKHLGDSNLVILPTIYFALITASELKILAGNLDGLQSAYWKKADLILKNGLQRAKHWGLTFFLLFNDEKNINQNEAKELPFLFFLEDLTFQLTRLKGGEKSVNILKHVIINSEESYSFPELRSFLESIDNDPFISLSKVYDRIISLLDTPATKEEKLNYWKQIIKTFCFILINSTKTPEVFISELKDNPSLIKNELQGILIGYFISKLYYDKPYEKSIPVVFLDSKKMRTIFPLSETLINSNNIIESAKVAKISLEKYFWTYVWGKPYSIFENPIKREVRKYQKRMIEAEEEVIVEEKTFGDFITISGDPRPTGIIHIKTKI